MRVSYRGHEVDVRRERCMAGYDLLYYTIVRESDGYVVVDGFQDSAEKVRDMVGYMKARVDDAIEHPDAPDARS